MVYFIVISILVHIFTIFALLVLYQRSTLTSTNIPNQTEDLLEIQQSMQSFITEIERENDVLFERINHLYAEKLLYMETKLKELDQKIEELDERKVEEQLLTSSMPSENTQPEATQPKAIQSEVTVETSLPQMEQVLDLYRQGFDIEQISKLLQIGKGEVSLMINLLKKHH